MSKKTTTQKVLDYLIKYPDAPVKDVAARFKTGISYVYSLRKKLKEPKRKVTLTPSQVKVAKKLGVSLTDYVKEGLNMGVLKYDDEVAEQDTVQHLGSSKWQPPEMVPMPELSTTNVDGILNDRAKDYGKFIEGAEIMQMLKRIVHNYIEARGTQLAFDQREALDMIMHKVGRIINGNPDKIDTWSDVAGYATLVADRLEGNAR